MSTGIQNPPQPAIPGLGTAPLATPAAPSEQAQYPAQVKAADLAGVPLIGPAYSDGASLADNLSRLNAAAPEVQQAVSAALAALPPDHTLKSVLDGLSADCMKTVAKAGSALASGNTKALTDSLSELNAALVSLQGRTDDTAAKTILAAGQKILDLLLAQPPVPAQIASALAELKTAAMSEYPAQAALAGMLYNTLSFMNSAGRTVSDLHSFQEMLTALKPLMDLLHTLKIADSRSAQVTQAVQFSLMAILSEMIVRQLEIQTERAEQDSKTAETERKAETEKLLQAKMEEDRAENKETRDQAAVAHLKSMALAVPEAGHFLNALVLARQVESGRVPQA
jgi:hypothetical protein